MGDLVAEGGDNRIVIRVAEGSEYIGNNESGKSGPVFFSPAGQQLPALALGTAEGIVAFFLGGGGEQDVRRGAGIFHGRDKPIHQQEVCVINDLWIIVPVERGKMNDDITFPTKSSSSDELLK
jgi:hypothetical protein